MKRFGVVVMVAGLALAACGQRGGSEAPAGRQRTVKLGRTDTGRTVSLNVGDTLELSFGSSSSAGGWRLAVYPKEQLSLESPASGERILDLGRRQ